MVGAGVWCAAVDVGFVSASGSKWVSCSSWVRSWRAIARALPAQRPRSAASFGSRAGPRTSSARPKIRMISVKPTSNIRSARLAVRLGRGAFLEVRVFRGRLLLGELFRLLVFALAHGLLEATHGRAEVRTDGLELLRPEQHERDHEDDEQFF